MNFSSSLRNESGYTLIETVVAMALFLSVLMPLGITIGNLILDNSAASMALALQAAQTEMTRIAYDHDYTNGIARGDAGLLIDRTVEMKGGLVDIQVVVSSVKHPGKKIIMLHKSLLLYQ